MVTPRGNHPSPLLAPSFESLNPSVTRPVFSQCMRHEVILCRSHSWTGICCPAVKLGTISSAANCAFKLKVGLPAGGVGENSESTRKPRFVPHPEQACSRYRYPPKGTNLLVLLWVCTSLLSRESLKRAPSSDRLRPTLGPASTRRVGLKHESVIRTRPYPRR